MANAIITGIADPGAAATGYGPQNHLIYAANQGAWWNFYLQSTNHLAAKYSTDGLTWTAPTGSPFTLAGTHGSEGRNFAFAYANIASTDVCHALLMYNTGAGSRWLRSKLGTTWTLGADTATSDSASVVALNGGVAIVDSADKPHYVLQSGSVGYANDASNADTGTAWTFGFAGKTLIYSGDTIACVTFGLASLGSGNLLALLDNSSTAVHFTQLNWETFTSGSWSHTNTNAVLASAVTSTSVQNWTMAGVATNDVHCIALSNNSNAYVHRRFNGSSWADGDAIPTLTLDAGSGLAAVTDGTYVWLFATSSKIIKYIKWTSGAGTPWGGGSGWVTLEDRSANNQPTYLTAAITPTGSAAEIAWTEVNGSNNEIWSANLNLSPPATTATLSGSTSGYIGTPVTYTITLDHPAGVGGVSCPVSCDNGAWTVATSPVVIGQGLTTGTFTVTPTSATTANVILSATTPSLSLAGTPISLTATVHPPSIATLTGPTQGHASTVSANFTITLDYPVISGTVSCPITSSDGSDTITSTPVVFGVGDQAKTFTVTASSSTGAHTITLGTTTPSLTIAGSPISYNVAAQLAWTSQQTGNSSAAATWGGTLANGDTVTIANGHVVTFDASVTLGASGSNVGHAFTINGTNSTTYGTLQVASGVTLTLAGADLTTNTMGLVNRYGVFAPQAGSTISGSVASDFSSIILCKGILNASGSSGSKVAFTSVSGAYTWGTQVTAEATVTSKSTTWRMMTSPQIGAFSLVKPWIANAAGTALGSLGDTSLSFPTTTGLTLTNEVASIAAISGSGDYYVNYDLGVVYYNVTGLSSATVQSTYKHLTVSKGWGIDISQNTDYNSAVFDYCTFKYMGTIASGDQGAIQVQNKYAASVNANRLFQFTNCTVSYCMGFLSIKNVNGNSGGTDNILIENNTFNETLGNVSYGGIFWAYQSASTYISFSSNTLSCARKAVIYVVSTNAVRDFTGWKIDSNTGIADQFIYNGFPIGFSASPICGTMGAGVISNNTIAGIGNITDSFMLDAVCGASGSPLVIRNNTFSNGKRVLGICSNTTFRNNKVYEFMHHAIVSGNTMTNGIVTAVIIQDNLFIVPRSDTPAVVLGYNWHVHLDNWLVTNNTCNGLGAVEFGDAGDGGACIITNAQVINNLSINSVAGTTPYGLQKGPDAVGYKGRTHATQVNNNLVYNASSAYSGLTHQAWFNRSGVAYNLDGTRNVLGVALFDASYSSPPAAQSLVLTVTTPDSNVTLAWGGGTPVQLIFGTNGTGTASSGTVNTLTVSGASWNTGLNNAACPTCCWLKITGGTGAGQIRAITTNTATVLTVSQAFSPTPDSSSTYAIYQSEAQLFDSGGTLYIRAGIYLPSLPTTTQTDTGITMTFAEVLSNPSLAVGSSTSDLTVADYIPGVSSSATAAGIATNAPTTDYLGLSFGTPPDIGALAFAAATSTNVAGTKGDAASGGEGCAINVYLGRTN